MSIRKLSIRAKLIGAFSVMVVLLAAMGALNLLGLKKVDAQMTDIAENWLPSVRAAGALDTRLMEFRLRIQRLGTTEPGDDFKVAEKDVQDTLRKMSEATASYEKTITFEEDRAQFKEFMAAWDAYQNEVRPLVEMVRKGERQRAEEQLAKLRPIGARAGGILTKLVAWNSDEAEKAHQRGDEVYD